LDLNTVGIEVLVFLLGYYDWWEGLTGTKPWGWERYHYEQRRAKNFESL